MRRFLTSFAAVVLLVAVYAANALGAAPLILKTSFFRVTTSSVRLEASIDPLGTATKYRFEYGPANCASNPCAKAPVPEGKIPAFVSGSGDLVEKGPDVTEEEAQTITNLTTTDGTFSVGDAITGTGIPPETTIIAVNPSAKTLKISKAATATATGVALTATGPQPAAVLISGLSPATTYHFRVVATGGKEKSEGPDRTFATYALPQVFEACSNDALRNQGPSIALPDCRAYEQASPIDKNGVDARGRVSMVKASLNGEAISYGAAGGIPGAEGAQELPMYLASRGSDGWSTQGLFPPQSAGQSTFVIGWTPDLSQTFSKATRLGPPDDTAFLERSSADHSITEVAPYGKGLIEPRFAGTSAAAAQVVFESDAKLLPAAVAGSSNVYSWDKATKTLNLASALNSESSPEGQSPPEGAFAGSYDWIAGTTHTTLASGGAAANYYTQDQHAVSSGGSVIFTSGGDGQLYLRRNPNQKQSKLDGEGKCKEAALACTLHLSASQKTNGSGVNGTDAAGTRPAAFLAAAEDGSSVLFSSTEKLTNDATTGPEPPPAAIGRSDIDGTSVNTGLCQTISKGVAVDGSHIYWTNPSAGTISRSDLGCTTTPEVIVSGANNPQYVAVDAEHIYWTNAAEGKDAEGSIGRAKLTAAGAEEVNEEFIKGATNPQGVALDAVHIYWSNAGEEDKTRTIGRAKLDGTEVDQGFLAVGKGPEENTPQGIAVNATHIYVTIDGTQQNSYISRYDIDGSLASEAFFFDNKHGSLPGVRGIALDGSHVYWARQGGNTIGRINLALEIGSAEREFIKAAGHPLGLAADGAHLYWSANGETQPNPGNDLYRYETATGKLSDLTVDVNPADPNGAEVKGILGTSKDASAVYFVANGDLDGVGPEEAGDCRGTAAASVSLNFSGECNLYLARVGVPVAFIARLDAGGEEGRSDAFDWLPRGGFAGQSENTARVAADGSAVLFRSQAQLSEYENEGTPELYRYQVGAAGSSCVSCDPSGAPASGAASFGNISLSTLIPAEFNYVLSRNLSADGKRAFFQSPDPLVGTDTNGEDGCPQEKNGDYSFPSCQDVYEWEAQGVGSCKDDGQGGGCLYLLSSGKSPQASFLGDASASGNDVFLITSQAGLVRQDQDQLFDVFDARVGGGLASQNQVAPVPCESSEGCSGPASTSPPFQSPSSATFEGPGNPKPACPKGKRRVNSKGKSRCVAKRQQKKKGHKRQTKKSGRASR